MTPLWLLLIALVVAGVAYGVKRARGTANDETAVDPDKVRR